MQFLQAFGLVATLATSVSALPQGDPNSWWQPPTTVAVDVPAATVTPVVPPSASASVSPSGSGGVTIINNLDSPIYLASTSNIQGPMQTLNKGDKFTETWRLNPDAGGISIKMGPSPEDRQNVLQFEYTLVSPKLYWDMSSINLLKTSNIVAAGFKVTTADGKEMPVECAPGNGYCNESYQLPDDINTIGTEATTSLILTLG